MFFRNTLFCLAFFCEISAVAQQNLEDLLAAGIADAQRFASGYIGPAAEGMIYNSANGWIQNAQVKGPLKFDISIVANGSFVKDSQKTFVLNTAEYNNLRFRDGSTRKEVATALGENQNDIVVYSVVSDGNVSQEVEFVLPQGLASAEINILPTAFLQARLGLFKATEIKLRYFPQINREDVKVGLYGAGIQHEFTQWLPAENVFPVAIAGFIGFTQLDGNYDFTDSSIVEGTGQKFDVSQSSWLFQLQASTKFPVFNLYGGLGYVSGVSHFNVIGNYRVRAGIPLLETTADFKDPFKVKNTVGGVRASVGGSMQLGFFALHADYSLAQFNNVSVGLHFGI